MNPTAIFLLLLSGKSQSVILLSSNGIFSNDGNITATDGKICKSIQSYWVDGNLLQNDFRLCRFNINYVIDGDIGVSDGRKTFIQQSCFVDGSISISDGRISQIISSNIVDGNLYENPYRLVICNSNYVVDGNLFTKDNILFGEKIFVTADGDLQVNGGVTGFQFLSSAENFIGDGDVLFNSGKISSTSQSYINDGDFSQTNIRFTVSNISYINDGNLLVKNNVLFGDQIFLTGDGDFQENGGVIGFQYLSSATSLIGDGDFQISSGRLCLSQISIISDGNFSYSTVRGRFDSINITADGDLFESGINIIPGITSNINFNLAGDFNLNCGRNTFLQINLSGEISLLEQLAQTGQIQISGNEYFQGDGDLQIGGGLIHSVNYVLTADGNLTIISPRAVGLDYIIDFSLKSPQTLNFKLRSITRVGV